TTAPAIALTASTLSAKGSACATCAHNLAASSSGFEPAPTAPAPTEKPNASSKLSCAAGPTTDPIQPRFSALSDCPTSSPTTITGDPMLHSAIRLQPHAYGNNVLRINS